MFCFVNVKIGKYILLKFDEMRIEYYVNFVVFKRYYIF